MAWFIPLMIFLSSFINKNSYWKLWKLDYACLIIAILALVLWFITSNPLLAIIFWILADFIAAIPLLIKMYYYPETETIWPFIAGLIANASAFLVIENWILEQYLFPLYLVIICTLLILTFYKKRIFWILS
jgi:riboflavin transporter FmnP